ncbi:type II and III secretion system protein family protein [Terasakiella pusilla]|uniref:type II and III secretion system protein family protein n=1 Tax=Terasakiella pusilla TaxID=64973 RepID=UPI003AA9331C
MTFTKKRFAVLSVLSALVAGHGQSAYAEIVKNYPTDPRPAVVEEPLEEVQSRVSLISGGAPSEIERVTSNRVVNLHVDQGTLLTFDKTISNVMVANPEIADFQVPSSKGIFVFGASAGITTLYAMNSSNKVVAAVELRVSHDLDEISEEVKKEIPEADIKLVAAAGNGIIVRGSVKTPLDARRVISAVKAAVGVSDTQSGGGAPGGGQQGAGGQGGGRGGQQLRVLNQLNVELSAQVNIRVRVVEVARSLSYQFGLNWDRVLNGGRFRIATGTSTTLFDAANAAGAVGSVASLTPAGQIIRQANTLGFTNGTMTGVLNALNQENLATLLAEPNLTALSGESAGFAAGGEVPIVVITNNNVSIDFKSFGVILRMTPTLLSPNRISLRIAPEVSALSDEGAVTLAGGSTIPAFKVRRAETTIELASGQSFALAGMLRSNVEHGVDGVPGLQRIPLLGKLFESETSSQKDTELVILATAYVVDPVTENELQVPGKGLPFMDAQLPARASAGYLY